MSFNSSRSFCWTEKTFEIYSKSFLDLNKGPSSHTLDSQRPCFTGSTLDLFDICLKDIYYFENVCLAGKIVLALFISSEFSLNLKNLLFRLSTSFQILSRTVSRNQDIPIPRQLSLLGTFSVFLSTINDSVVKLSATI